MDPKKSKSASVGKKKSLKKKWTRKSSRRSPVKPATDNDFDREENDNNIEISEPIREVPAYGEEEDLRENEEKLKRKITELEKKLQSAESATSATPFTDEEKQKLEESASKYRDENDELIHEKILIMQQKAKLERERN